MDITKINKLELINILNKTRTCDNNKETFWLELKKNTTSIKDTNFKAINNLIDMPDKVTRDNFIKDYSIMPLEDTLRILTVNISDIKNIKDVYLQILKGMCVAKNELKVKKIEDLEYSILSKIKRFDTEIVMINYSGEKLQYSNNVIKILYNLYAMSEISKVTFNLLNNDKSTPKLVCFIVSHFKSGLLR